MKKVLIILGCILALILIIVVAAQFILGNAEDEAYYELGSDRVASVKEVVGKRDITELTTETSGGVLTKTIKYKTDPNNQKQAADDVAAYFNYITEQEGFASMVAFDGLPYEGGVEVKVAKESIDEGKVIILTITYDPAGYTLVFTKSEGTFTLT